MKVYTVLEQPLYRIRQSEKAYFDKCSSITESMSYQRRDLESTFRQSFFLAPSKGYAQWAGQWLMMHTMKIVESEASFLCAQIL